MRERKDSTGHSFSLDATGRIDEGTGRRVRSSDKGERIIDCKRFPGDTTWRDPASAQFHA
jgi:hypothetical protein